MGVEKATQTLRAKNAFKCSAKSAKYKTYRQIYTKISYAVSFIVLIDTEITFLLLWHFIFSDWAIIASIAIKVTF